MSKPAAVFHRITRSNRSVQDYLALVCTREGRHRVSAKLHAARLKKQLARHIANDDLSGVLLTMARLERLLQLAGFDAGRMVADEMVSEAGRARLRAAAEQALKRVNDSAYLLSLIALCRALEGEYRPASRSLLDMLNSPAKAPKKLAERRVAMLQSTWRAVDLIARGNMDWADEGAGYRRIVFAGAEAWQEETGHPELLPDAILDNPTDRQSRKESALQGRHREAYLQICQREFQAANTPAGKLSALKDMLGMGIRHMPEYHSSFQMAADGLREIEAELQPLLLDEALTSPKSAKATIKALCNWLTLAARLKLDDQQKAVTDRLISLSTRDELLPALWSVPVTLEKVAGLSDVAHTLGRKLAGEKPAINQDLQNFFRWASLAHEYALAEQFYQALPKSLGRPHGLLDYANILQRQSRFYEAQEIVRDVHAQILANPSLTKGFGNFSLIKRRGELEFLIKTAEIYQSVPQPTAPKGLLMAGFRNIDQLRRYPIMALVEFKRRGWAVVPLVEGLLPFEPTGLPEVDALNGALSPHAKLVPDAEGLMPDQENVTWDADHGRLVWNGLDLSHQVWEDAAINRRRYTVDYRCPELQKYIGNLVDWTKAMGRVLEYAHGVHHRSQLPMATMAQFSSRLPDGIFRKYSDTFGSADGFFHLAAANGYQNYFTNFSTNVSQRFVLRNMTRHADVRSPSFPVPAFLEQYYQDKQAELPQIIERFAATPKVKRSTEGSRRRPAEADALDARIRDWRTRGGKVACAFGKVVCDIGVPFDGGPTHHNMKDWINHAIRTVQGSDTLLLIKPHPHELNDQIATFPTEYFADLIEEPLGDNAILLGHRWFDIYDLKSRIDMGVIYNGTTTIELGLLGIPCLLTGHFAPIDYPIGHVAPETREDFEAYLRGETPLTVAPDLKERAAVWLDYMANESFTQPYRYHVRPVTNRLIYPPYWFDEDLERHTNTPDPAVVELVSRALGTRPEPGAQIAPET